MKLIATAKLLPAPEQAAVLLATLERANAACNWLAERAFELKSADKYKLQQLHYHDMREQFGLSAQMTLLAIHKVAAAYKRDKATLCHFGDHSAIAYDQRILSFKAMDRVSLLTISGRILLPYVAGPYHRARLEGVRGQSDLVFRKNQWFLYVTVDVPDGSPVDPEGWLGVDLGIRNLAVDSDGEANSGAAVEAARRRYQRLRNTLRSIGTKSAKRHLKKIADREARFRSHTSHCISKHIVAKAKDTARGIAIENLTGIRQQTTVRKAQRAMCSGWAFLQLRAFLSYKAAIAGVKLVAVDPRNTSRTCLACGHIDRANRRSQSEFRCTACGFADNADHVGAVNIARRAAVNWPIVSNYSDKERYLSGLVRGQGCQA